MSFKLNNSQKDNLYWFFPFLFMGLALLAIFVDKGDRKETLPVNKSSRPDSSIVISTKTLGVDTLNLNTQTFDGDLAIPMAF